MKLPKCPHGCYNGTKDGEPSYYCSGCQAPEINNGEDIGRLALEWEEKINTLK